MPRFTAISLSVMIIILTGCGSRNLPLPDISIDDVSVSESGSGQTADLVFTVTISEEPRASRTITVDWIATDGTAKTFDIDYLRANGTLTFTNGGTLTQQVTVVVNGDDTIEPDEMLYVNLSNAVNATVSDNQGTGTITNDDWAVFFVDPTGDGTNGLTWATAYNTVQEAADAASIAGGGEVWVAAATYDNGGGTTAVLTMRYGVHVYGGFDGYGAGLGAQETSRAQRDFATNVTILDGQDTAYHVVTGAPTATIDGFVVRGGYANGPPGSGADERGGGMYINGCSPLVKNCLFTHNRADYGGGMYNDGGMPEVRNVYFSYNDAVWGGGLETRGASATIVNCVFTANSSSQASALYNGTGGDSSITNCTFAYNVAMTGTAGIYNWGSEPTIENCILWKNLAPGFSAEMYNGYDVIVTVSYTDLEGGLSGSKVYNVGNGIYVDGGENINAVPLFLNVPARTDITEYGCTTTTLEIANPSGYAIGDLLEIDGDGIQRTVTGVSGTIVAFSPACATDVPPYKVIHNWGSNTDFQIDLRLMSMSPCIDEGNASSAPSTDIDGNVRPALSGVDIGAYEYQP